jgi:hypothetical protein
MEFISIVSVLIGIGIVVYLKRYAKEAVLKEASREASHIKTVELVDYELEKINAEWKRDGVLSEKDKAFMDALYSRRIQLQRQGTH